jgi:type IV pilus assembly protein PilB
MHTNDAPSALPRLVEMGIETYLVASAIDCVVAQRLARKLCMKCRGAYHPQAAELAQAGFPEEQWASMPEFFRPVGCASCASTGYRGRLGMYEVMLMTEEIERLVVERSSLDAIRRSAQQDGMVTLRQDGLEKVRLGLTSIHEILRVIM